MLRIRRRWEPLYNSLCLPPQRQCLLQFRCKTTPLQGNPRAVASVLIPTIRKSHQAQVQVEGRVRIRPTANGRRSLTWTNSKISHLGTLEPVIQRPASSTSCWMALKGS